MNTKTRWLCAAAFFALPGLTGCGGSSSSANGSSPILGSAFVTAALPNGLTARLAEDRSAVSVGGTVTYTATLTNSTAQPITYHSLIGPANFANFPAALTVTNPSGQLIFPFGPQPQVVSIGPTVTLTPGQSVSAAIAVTPSTVSGVAVSPGYATAGQYTASASFSVVPGTSSSDAQAVGATAGPLSVVAQ